ncbi:hypothetical protein [Vibrio gigantis]|uniref:hypothetical protein n=1 Tax=Vibrio gigantis TaxID=296199 RepID=UPI001BFD0579|nr:hypothetical protein [Vibrio gigantis]
MRRLKGFVAFDAQAYKGVFRGGNGCALVVLLWLLCVVMRSLLGIDWRRCLQMDCLGCLRVHRCDEGWSGCALVV